MKITISIHIFGSIRGYATIACSSMVTEQEKKELEQFSFGQTNSQDYLNSLSSNPAIISKKLCSGRWAITRVMKGTNDEYNRCTLLFVTAILSENDWLYSLKCNMRLLLSDNNIWNWSSLEAVSEIYLKIDNTQPFLDISDSLKKKTLYLLSAIEANPYKSLVVREEEYNLDVIYILTLLLPRSHFITS